MKKCRPNKFILLTILIIILLQSSTGCLGNIYRTHIENFDGISASFEYPRFNARIGYNYPYGKGLYSIYIEIQNIIRQNIGEIVIDSYDPNSDVVKNIMSWVYQEKEPSIIISKIIDYNRTDSYYQNLEVIEIISTKVAGESSVKATYSYTNKEKPKYETDIVFEHGDRIWWIAALYDKNHQKDAEKYLNHLIETFQFVKSTSISTNN